MKKIILQEPTQREGECINAVRSQRLEVVGEHIHLITHIDTEKAYEIMKENGEYILNVSLRLPFYLKDNK